MFFFAKFYENLKAHEENEWFFKPPQPEKPVKMSSESGQAYAQRLSNWTTAKDAAKKANERAFQRTGWRSIYTRLLKDGSFKQPDKSPLESVMLADFNEVIRLISLQNAG